jgi:hypothetical protein
VPRRARRCVAVLTAAGTVDAPGRAGIDADQRGRCCRLRRQVWKLRGVAVDLAAAGARPESTSPSVRASRPHEHRGHQGTSALAETVAGIARPEHGQVLLSGTDMGTSAGASERRARGPLLSPEPLLVEASLRDNLLLGANGARRRSTQRARVPRCGTTGPENAGLDGRSGGGGWNPSPAERQRIAGPSARR